MKDSKDSVLSLLTDELINGLTGNDIKTILLYINSKVRNISVEENKFCEETMCAGGLVSPNNEIQNRYFEKIAEALKNVNGKKEKATMMFYLINELHLFEDGNGRTSRAVFEILTKEDFSFEDNDTLMHDSKNDSAKVSYDDFQRNNRIEGSMIAEQCSNFFLYKALIESGVLPNEEFYKSKIVIRTDADELLEHNMNEGVNEDNNPVYVPEEVRKQLSYKQFKQVQNSLADNNGQSTTTSGMALLLFLINKGKFDTLSYYADVDGEVLFFPVDRETGTGEEALSDFCKEDYLKIVEIADFLKEGMLDTIISFFEHPNNFKFAKNVNMKDILMNGNAREMTAEVLNFARDPKFIDDAEICRVIKQNGMIDVKGTLTESTVRVLREFLSQDILRKNNIVEVGNLGGQVISEMSDTTLEDETEKAIVNQEKLLQQTKESQEVGG